MRKNIKKAYWLMGSSISTVSFSGITKALFLGDSIMNGSLASPSSNCYRSLLTSFYSWTAQDLSLGGSGMWNEAKNANQGTYTRVDTVIMTSAGLNDIRRSHSTQTFNKIESCLRTNIVRAFTKSGTAVASGSASVTRVGSFTVFSGFSFGHVYGSVGSFPDPAAMVYNTTANATWTYTFTGTGVAVCFSGAYPSVTRGNVEIRIDGVLVETITDLNQRYDGVSDGVYDNQRGPDTRYYLGLTNAAHSIEVKALSTSAVPVDFFCVIDSPSNLGVVLVIDVPKVLDYAKAGLDQANDSYVDQVNTLKRSVVAPWLAAGYKIRNVQIMPPYYLSAGVTIDGTDLVHPLNAGHALIYSGIKRYIA